MPTVVVGLTATESERQGYRVHTESQGYEYITTLRRCDEEDEEPTVEAVERYRIDMDTDEREDLEAKATHTVEETLEDRGGAGGVSFARVLYLMNAGLSLTQAADLVAVENHQIPAEAWADARDVTPRAVEKNLTDARRHLGIEDDPDEAEQEVLA